MSEKKPQNQDAPSKSPTGNAPQGDAGEAEVQAQFDQEAEQGYRGVVADPTPNRAYTVGGVAAGEPTPENDAGAAKAADAHRAEVIDAPKRGDEQR